MIRHISIRNFAIIEKADIDLTDGLNIITGETGAGKSIVIEAVSLALGSRADTAFVRSGADKSTVQMIADYKGNEYIITREVSATGRNTCRINDEIVTLGALNGLCSKLADIHGQYDHQSLLNTDNHIRLVDLYLKDAIEPAKAKVSSLFDSYTALRSELVQLKSTSADNLRQKDFMTYELQELYDANLRSGEDRELEEEIALLQNSEKIFAALGGAYQLSSDGDYNILSALKQVNDMLTETSGFTAELSTLSQQMTELYYEYEDICRSIRESRDSVIFDPGALDTAIARSEHLKKLKHKHNKDINGLIAYIHELESTLSYIENSDEYIAHIEQQITETEAELQTACDALTEARRKSALQLETLIGKELKQLNFGDAEFAINFAKSSAYTSDGNDVIEFLITTNKGEPLKPLSRIASGGEMSRIMLAFKKIIGDYDRIPTMIFDEIDSGISGIAASVVGRKLREISGSHQIICITHLPQIAAYGTANYRISKHSDGSLTYTTVEALTEEEKINEIARLLGGENITETTLASARELIAASQ